MLATRFAKNATVIRSESPLTEDQMIRVAPSIFAPAAHVSRSERYSYVPTIDVLRGLSKEGFKPFMAAQSKSRIEGKSEFTKHLLRLRYVGDVTRQADAANEIILINSHDGTSSYQMLSGVFRFMCLNGMVTGTIAEDFRVKHTGDVRGEVIDAAFRVLDDFEKIDASVEGMKALTLDTGEQKVFARAAAMLRFGALENGEPNTPVNVDHLLTPRRAEDVGSDLWRTFNRIQENTVRGGLRGRNTTGRRMTTREVQGIDRNVSLNRALWALAEGMKGLKAGRSVEDLVAA